MPSVADKQTSTAYLPALDKVFTGDIPLISWSTAYEILIDPDHSSQPLVLQDFLNDDHTVKALASCLQPLRAPNGQSKADFETRTASINVTPLDSGDYDIKQIKDDALWLSNTVRADEVVALRTVILEWQSRTAAHILQGYSEEEVLSLQQSKGALRSFGISTLRSSFGASLVTERTTDQKAQKRRTDILQIWFQEHERLLAVAVYLQTIHTLSLSQHAGWIEDAAQKVEESRRGALNAGKSPSEALAKLMEVLERQISLLGGEDSVALLDDLAQSALANQQRGRLLQMIHLLRLIYVEASSASHLSSSVAIAHWFRLMETSTFLQGFEVAEHDQQTLVDNIHSLIALISVQLLDYSRAKKLLGSDTLIDATSWYVFDSECCRQICSTMNSAAAVGIRVAAPAMLCWGIIGNELRQEYSDSPARRLSLDSDDGARSPTLSRSDGSPLGDAWQHFQDIDVPLDSDKDLTSKNPEMYLAEVAANRLDVFGLLAALSGMVKSLWAAGLSAELQIRARSTLLDVIRFATIIAPYNAETLGATMAILQPEPESTTVDRVIVNDFLNDQALTSAFLSQALLRYPFELQPLLELCNVLAAGDVKGERGDMLLTELLQDASQFTLQMPPEFNDYQLVRGQGPENRVRLTEDLELFTVTKAYTSFLQRLTSSDDRMILFEPESQVSIPAGSIGLARTDSRPFIGTWKFNHSVLGYLAALLATAIPSVQKASVLHSGPLPRAEQAGIMRLFATQIKALLRDTSTEQATKLAKEQAQELLGAASENLPDDFDIISVVGELLETELAAQPLQSDDDSVDILDACVIFLEATIPVVPDRIWPLLARVGLIDSSEQSGKLSAVVASIEIASGRYTFLLACLRLFSALVADVVQNAVARVGNNGPAVRKSRFEDVQSHDTGLPQRMVAQIIEAFGRTFLEVLRSNHDWRFADVNEQFKVNCQILEVFHRIVKTAYGFDDRQDESGRLFNALAPAAGVLITTHCGESGELNIDALIGLCVPTSDDAMNTATETALLVRKQTQSALEFLTLLLQVGTLKATAMTKLKRHLFQAVPAMVRIYIGEPYQRLSAIHLLTALARSAVHQSDPEEEVPSLFGHLGPSTSQNVIKIFAKIDKPTYNVEVEVAVWEFFSAVLSSKQQWFATFLLTGSIPNKSFRTAASTAAKQHKSVLDQALDALSNSGPFFDHVAVVRLLFVRDAVNYWPWSIARLQTHPHFIDRMCYKLHEVEEVPEQRSQDKALWLAWHIKGVAVLSELLAMYLHHLRRMGDVSKGKQLADSVYFFRANYVKDPTYSYGSHDKFEELLHGKLPACKLQSFKHLLPSQTFGPDFVYGTSLAHEALSTHVQWSAKREEESMAWSLKNSNFDLSLVEAQVENLKSLRYLAVEFSNYAKDDTGLQSRLATVVRDCLTANRDTKLEALIFENFADIRSEIALPVLQRLVDHRSDVVIMRTLLIPAWNAILDAADSDFDTIMISGDTGYYRVLLRLLLLTLQPLTYSRRSKASDDDMAKEMRKDEKVAALLGIARDVVARGFKSLCNQIHDDPVSVLPSDFALLTAIFQSIMHVHTEELSGLENRVAAVLTEEGLTRFATSLFSWSDRLTPADDDPIYGELAINFIREMSCIPAIAEMLAADGILAQLTAANITALYRRKNGIGPFDEPIRLHSIWSRGILPTCLNVLVAAGESFASEVATFLNSFPPQLERASAALDPQGLLNSVGSDAGRITLNSACEAHTLALISTALEQTGQDGTVLSWDRAGVRDDLEGWVQGSRAALRERIVPTTEKELALHSAKPVSNDKESLASSSRLEEMIFQELKGALFVLNGGGA